MRKTLLIIPVLLLSALTSCDDEEGSYPPTWKGFTYTPSTVHAGDQVTITAVQAKKGHYQNSTDYKFTMTVKLNSDGTSVDSTLSYSRHTNYDGEDNGDPKWEFTMPDNTRAGSYTCTFNATWSNSADGEVGTYSCTGGDGCTGSINSECSTLYSNASGSFNLPVRQ